MSLASGMSGLSDPAQPEDVEVTVATSTPRSECDDRALPFRIVRRPTWLQLAALFRRTDVVHLAGPCFVPMALSLLFRKPVVLEHSGYQSCCPNGSLLDERTQRPCSGHFVNRRYRECLRCNAVNEGWKKSTTMLLLGLPRRWMSSRMSRNVAPTHHVESRIDLPRSTTIYHGVPLSTTPGGSGSATVPACFAYVGRLVPQKGLRLLVAAAKQLQTEGHLFRLKFIGDGPERPALEHMVTTAGLGDYVTFTGFLRGRDLEDSLRDVSAVIMPSIWEETFGLSALEQMMRGSPVIAADIGGLGEVVGDAGMKFAAGDVEGLALRMRQVIVEPALVKTLGEKAYRRAAQLFQEKLMVARHAAVYHELLSPTVPSVQHTVEGCS